MTSHPPTEPLDVVLPRAHFVERHHRTVAAPAEDVWAEALGQPRLAAIDRRARA